MYTITQYPTHSYSLAESSRKAIGIYTKLELEKIQNSTVLLCGSGGANGPIVDILGRLGLQRFIIADIDKQIEYKNLVEQPYFSHEVGLPKAIVKKQHLQSISPSTEAIAVVADLSREENMTDLIEKYNPDLIIEGVDNILARMVICQSVHKYQKPLLTGANIGLTYFINYYTNQDQDHYGQVWNYLDLLYPNKIVKQNGFPDIRDTRTLKILQKEWIIWGLAIGDFDNDTASRILENPIDWPYIASTGYQVAAHKSLWASQILAGRKLDQTKFIFNTQSNQIISLDDIKKKMIAISNSDFSKSNL